MNYERDTSGRTETHRFEIAPYGDARTEVEKAAQRAFHGGTADVRAALVAAGVAEVNPSHAHSRSYKDRAEDMNVSRETFERGGMEYVRVTIQVEK